MYSIEDFTMLKSKLRSIKGITIFKNICNTYNKKYCYKPKQNPTTEQYKIPPQKKIYIGTSLVAQKCLLEQRHRFDPWPGEIPRAIRLSMDQLQSMSSRA